MWDAELIEPGRPSACDGIVTEFQDVVLIADTVGSGQPAGDPIGLMHGKACTSCFRTAQQVKQFRQCAACAMSTAFLRRNRGNARRFLCRATIVVHQPRRAGATGRVDQQQRTGRAVDTNPLDSFKIDAASELADRNHRRVPPQFGVLINRSAVLKRWGQGGRLHAQDVAVRIEGAGADAARSDVDAEEHTRHDFTSSPSGRCGCDHNRGPRLHCSTFRGLTSRSHSAIFCKP